MNTDTQQTITTANVPSSEQAVQATVVELHAPAVTVGSFGVQLVDPFGIVGGPAMVTIMPIDMPISIPIDTVFSGPTKVATESDDLLAGLGFYYGEEPVPVPVLDGRGGVDTVLYGRGYAQFDVSVDGEGNVVITPPSSASVGRQTLKNVEFVSFGDLRVAVENLVAVAGQPTRHLATAANDVLVGNDLGYGLSGGEGDDTLTGNGGDDRLYGGKGDDTAVYRGARSEYEVTVTEYGAVTVRDLVPGRDGTDHLGDIERLRFADGEGAVPPRIQYRIVVSEGDDVIHGLDGYRLSGALPPPALIDGLGGKDTVNIGFGFQEAVVGRNADGDVVVKSTRVGGEQQTLKNVEFVSFAGTLFSVPALLAVLGQPVQHAGSEGNDVLIGNDLGYMLHGGGGDDTLTGNGGDDTLYGGKGDDTAVYRGARAEYEILSDEYGQTFVRDLVAGRDGKDLLVTVEHVRFADGVFDLSGLVAAPIPSEPPTLRAATSGSQVTSISVDDLALLTTSTLEPLLVVDVVGTPPSCEWSICNLL